MGIVSAAFLASVIWIIAGGVLYTYPPFKRMYKRAEKSPSVKKWDNPRNFLIAQFVSVFVQCFLFAVVFSATKVALSPDPFMQALQFGLIILGIKVIPRTMKMAVHTTYPGNMLFIEFLSSTIGAFGVSFIFVFLV